MAHEVSLKTDDSNPRYGDVTIAGEARVHMGDIHYRHDPVSTESDIDTWRGRFFDALTYHDMDGKSQQLDSIDAPTASFEWVHTTRIPEWLEQGSGIFWISGKPGSGKSVLMKHLASSHSTKQRLQGWKEGCLILEFFFDFRAAKKEANDISGMMKLFLFQLSRQSDAATKHFRLLNASKELGDANVAKLCNLISSTVQRCDLPVCAFVDGLDEYEGDWVDLVDILQRLQERTGMKICLASRPEPQLKQLLHAYSTIVMQNHNVASIRVYINRALTRACRYNPDVGAKFTGILKDEIMLKAQGIILWARLAVDELIRACSSGKSVDEMQQILDALPAEVEEMYQRILSKLHRNFAAESAMLLQVVSAWPRAITIQLLFGLWDLFAEDFSMPVENFHNMSISGFCERMDHILGTLVDVLPNHHVRLLHRTFHDYLISTRWISKNSLQGFEEQFPDHKHLRICTYIVVRATADRLVSETKVDDYLAHIGHARLDADQNQTEIWKLCDFNGNVHWPRRTPVLVESAYQLAVHFRSNVGRRLEPFFPTFSFVLTTPLMLKVYHDNNNRIFDLQVAPYGPAFPLVLDLVFAVRDNALQYAQWRLQTPLSDMAQIQALLDISINMMLVHEVLKVSPDTAHVVASAMVQLGAHRTRYHSCLLMSQPLSHPSTDRVRAMEQTRKFLSRCPQDLQSESHHRGCPDRNAEVCLLFVWVRKFGERPSRATHVDELVAFSRRILDFITDSGEQINDPCYERGTALHAAVDPLLRKTDSDQPGIMTLEVVKTLIDAGADPRVEYLGYSPYDYAKRWQSATSNQSWFKRKTKRLLGKQQYGWQNVAQGNGQTMQQSASRVDSISPENMHSILELLKPK